MTTACLSEERLGEYLAGRIDERQSDAVERHLQACPRCQTLLTAYDPPTDSLFRALRETSASASVDREPELAAALSAIAQSTAGIGAGQTQVSLVMPGAFIRDYELRQKLGEGGMGSVFLAMHTKLAKQVAVKLLRSDRLHDPSAIARFAVEMQAAGKLEHENLVRAFDAGEENGIHFLVMEYIAGVDLAQLLRCVGPLPLADACELVRQAATGLAHAHEQRVIHRDIKPSNLRLSASGSLKVLDMGLAQFRMPDESHGLTRDNQVVGTLLYVAPEQVTPGGKVDARSDIYSLGIAFGELLLGSLPRKAALDSRLSPADKLLRPEVPAEIWQLIERMTALLPADRPARMLNVAAELKPWTAAANLPSLLARVAGHTSYAGGEPPLLEQASGWTPAMVPPPMAPPVTESWMAPPPAPVIVNSAERQRASWANSPWSAAAALAMMAVGLAAAIVWNWKPGKTPPPPVATHGTLALADDPLLGRLIAGKNLNVIDEGSQQVTPVTSFRTELKPGNYRLQCLSPELTLTTEPLVVAAGQEARPDIALTPAPGWPYPRLPNAGESAVWTGKLRLEAEGPALPFELELHLLADETRGAERYRWLKVVVDQQDYVETAWLRLDSEIWEQANRLDIREGWIVAWSKDIQQRLAQDIPQLAATGLVVPYANHSDTVQTTANRVGIVLPEPRVTVHQVLALLFGQTQLTLVPPPLRQFRYEAAATAASRVSLKPQGSLPGDCLVVESLPPQSKKGQPGFYFYLARNPQLPFSFAKVEATGPELEARLDLKRPPLRATPRPAAELLAAVEGKQREFTEAAQKIKDDLRGTIVSFATIPKVAGAEAHYRGTLKKGLAELDFDAWLRMEGGDPPGNLAHRWIQVVVHSRLRSSPLLHREEARILVDAEAYNDGEGPFEILRGQFAVGWSADRMAVFDFDPRGDLHDVDEQLRLLGSQLPPGRLGVHEVLLMMFNAQLKAAANLGNLRSRIAGLVARAGGGRDIQPVYLDVGGLAVSGNKFVLPESIEKGTSYTYCQSSEIPFSFYSAATKVGEFFDLGCELGSRRLKSELPTVDDWQAASGHTRERVAAERREQPNMRLWTLKPGRSDEESLWAELGAISERDPRHGKVVVVRENSQVRSSIPWVELGPADREFATAGRAWRKPDPADTSVLRGQCVGVRETAQGTYVRIRWSEGGQELEYEARRFSAADRRWINELLTLQPQPTKKLKGR